MKFKLNKLIWSIIITITIFNLFISIFETSYNQVLASDGATAIEEIDEEAEDDSIFDTIISFGAGVAGGAVSGLGFLIDGAVGLISKFIQIPLLIIATVVQGFIWGIAKVNGSEIEGFVTPDDIIFNRVGITNINFFDISSAGDQSIVQTIRINIATWYYILRVFATVILLAVLIYIGIRMALSTVASEQAQYKRMLKDWAVSFALIFFLNYIIIFTLEVNNALVALLSKPAKVTIGSGVMTSLTEMIVLHGAIKSWGAFIVYFSIIGMTAAFLIMYMKRMLTIGFLIIISPLITITYSIDKAKDGKAQAVNTWLKEFIYNVLIQPFHCIIYLTFVSTILNTLGTKASLVKLALAVMCIRFVWKAEEIVKTIFGFKGASSMAEGSLAAVATVNSIARTLSKQGGRAANAVANHTQFGQNIANKISSTRVGQMYQNASNSYRNLLQSNSVGGALTRAATKTLREGKAVGIGIAAGSMEMGANTKANAFHVGVESYGVAKSLMDPNKDPYNNYNNLQASKKDFDRYADLIANNNNFAFQNYRTDVNNKNNLKTYAQSLIGANMDYLNDNIQNALRHLSATDPNYDVNTQQGMQFLRDLQDMALNQNLDFNDPNTNPLHRNWTQAEKDVVTAIQVRNLAGAVNGLHQNYQVYGSPNANQDIDNYIDTLT